MTLKRYDVWETEDIICSSQGRFVKLDDVIELIKNFKLTNKDYRNNEFDVGWNSCIDGLLKETK